LGYGTTPADQDFGEANDPTSVAGLIGLNVGAAGAFGLSLLWDPTASQVGYMWAGAGIGVAASLPVYLLYIGDDRPPARRGFIFTATALTLGIGVGGLLGSEGGPLGAAPNPGGLAQVGNWLTVESIAPMPIEGGLGVAIGGSLF
jgi:hypothetical protein